MVFLPRDVPKKLKEKCTSLLCLFIVIFYPKSKYLFTTWHSVILNIKSFAPASQLWQLKIKTHRKLIERADAVTKNASSSSASVLFLHNFWILLCAISFAYLHN